MAISHIGLSAAIELARVLAELDAVENVAQFKEMYPSSMVGLDADGQAILLRPGYRILFRVNHIRVPRTSTASIDWGKVSRIRIEAVERIDDRRVISA